MAGSVAEPISDHRTPRQVESALPGAPPCGVLNQSGSSLWEAQGIRTPLIRIAVASGRIGTIRSTLQPSFLQNFASSAAMKLRPGELVPEPWIR